MENISRAVANIQPPHTYLEWLHNVAIVVLWVGPYFLTGVVALLIILWGIYKLGGL